jgi:hypothetical protein
LTGKTALLQEISTLLPSQHRNGVAVAFIVGTSI